MHDAQPGDIYVDEANHVWRVVGVITEPSVVVEDLTGPVMPDGIRSRRSGGVSGFMWRGFVRIFRPEEAA